MATKTNAKKATSTVKKTAETVKESVAETVETTAEKANVTNENVNVTSENELLKKQVAEMQAQMKMMVEMIANNNHSDDVPEKNVGNRMIRFVSLKDGTIVLKGSSFWEIEGRFGYRDFPEKEARLIALNMASYLRKGSVYIDDAQFVKENDLDYVYATLLSDKDLKELLDTNAAKVIETYKNVNDNQKEIIIDMIIADKKNGKKIDNNVLVELSALSGKNLLNPDEDEDE